MKRKWLSACVAALLAMPLYSLAENIVTVLPTAIPQVGTEVSGSANTADVYTIDLEGYYANQNADDASYQYPAFSSSERERLPTILARYQSGERPGESILNKTSDVSIGVYPIKPEDYTGQTVYVLLPNHELTDNELLALADAYAQLGESLTSDSLSWRNCMRGGGIESTRSFVNTNERERFDVLTEQYKRQGLRPAEPFTAIPGDDGVGLITLNPDDFSGLEEYSMRPARRMTDEELLRIAQIWYGDEQAGSQAYSNFDQMTRQALSTLVGAPLSITRISENFALESDFHLDGSDRPIYNAEYHTVNEENHNWSYWSILTTEDGKLTEVFVSPYDDKLQYSDLRLDPFDSKWQAIANTYIPSIRLDDVAIASTEARGEVPVNNLGYGADIAVTMADGSYYELSILYQTEQPYQVHYYLTTPAPMPVVNN